MIKKLINIIFLLSLFISIQEVECKRRVIDISSFHYELNLEKKWTEVYPSKRKNIHFLLNLLDHSRYGRFLKLKMRKKLLKEKLRFEEVIFIGKVSQVKSSYIRYRNQNRKIILKRKSKIYLGENLTVMEATLSLAHELTHYLKEDVMNPYHEKFNPKNYLFDVIEGEGGEVDAFFAECMVGLELFPKHREVLPTCFDLSIMIDGKRRVIKDHILKELYKVGNYISQLNEMMSFYQIDKDDFQEISEQTPRLISAVHSLPYPLAILLDFHLIKEKVKKNDKNLKN